MEGPAIVEGAGAGPAGETATINTQCQSGMTLIEILVVISIIAILSVAVGSAFFVDFSSETKVRTAARQLMADLQFAQSDAASQGGAAVADAGQIRRRWEYVVFDTLNNSYSIWRYQDTDGDNIKDPDEVSAGSWVSGPKNTAEQCQIQPHLQGPGWDHCYCRQNRLRQRSGKSFKPGLLRGHGSSALL